MMASSTPSRTDDLGAGDSASLNAPISGFAGEPFDTAAGRSACSDASLFGKILTPTARNRLPRDPHRDPARDRDVAVYSEADRRHCTSGLADGHGHRSAAGGGSYLQDRRDPMQLATAG
jgi:hypothetical protein